MISFNALAISRFNFIGARRAPNAENLIEVRLTHKSIETDFKVTHQPTKVICMPSHFVVSVAGHETTSHRDILCDTSGYARFPREPVADLDSLQRMTGETSVGSP